LTARAAIVAAGALMLGATIAAAQQGAPRGGRVRMMAAPNPSAVVSAELAFARLAQVRGQWTAFRETAADDAIMFVPGTVNARDWLRRQTDPAQAVRWSPRAVYVSCDGGYALSTGPWTRPDGSSGTFNTIWRRQRKGGFKWVLDFGSDRPFSAGSDDMLIDGKVADCAGRRGPGGPGGDDEGDDRRRPRALPVVEIPNPPPQSGEGQSNDGTLRWRWTNDATSRALVVTMRYQGEEREIAHETATPAPATATAP